MERHSKITLSGLKLFRYLGHSCRSDSFFSLFCEICQTVKLLFKNPSHYQHYFDVDENYLQVHVEFRPQNYRYLYFLGSRLHLKDLSLLPHLQYILSQIEIMLLLFLNLNVPFFALKCLIRFRQIFLAVLKYGHLLTVHFVFPQFQRSNESKPVVFPYCCSAYNSNTYLGL